MIKDALDKAKVLRPDHYRKGRVEAIDIIRDALGKEGFESYCVGQVFKYLIRAKHKGSFEDDMGKAHFYMSMIVGHDPRT